VLLGCGGAALLVLILGVACTVALFAGGPVEEESGESVGMGEPGTVGQWVVTVTDVEEAATSGDAPEEEAQGEFVLVNVTVENSGTEAAVFDDSAVSLIDADGNTYSSSGTGDDPLFGEQIDPGDQVSGSVTVDVPEGAEITAVEVRNAQSGEGPLLVQLD